MKKDRIFVKYGGLVLLCMLILVGTVKFYQHEKWQNELLSEVSDENYLLRQQNASLSDKIDSINRLMGNYEDEGFNSQMNYTGGYNYLAIGNSITVHGKCEYWWNEIGMAATKEENDYFHIVTAYLQEKYKEIGTQAFNFSTWEMQNMDRSEALSLLDSYLNEALDLVTVQLSENVTDLVTFDSDYKALIAYIQNRCPNAQIIIVDDFWNAEKSVKKWEIAQETGLAFASLAGIRGNEKYQCGLGTVVYGDDGEEHIVEHQGVAGHPNDLAMKYIAEMIISNIESRD